MSFSFLHSFQSEWMKRKRSLASWMVLAGGFFTPTIIIIARLTHAEKLPDIYAKTEFWTQHWKNSWESMAIFLLPVGVIMATSLVTQLEYKNNTWKQLHTLPLTLTTIFFSKLTVILLMMVQFLLLFNLGIFLSALVPYWLVGGVPYPAGTIPYSFFMRQNIFYFIDCLPIIALQYCISIQFKNFLVPLGAGFLLWIGSIVSLSWKYGYSIPYTYCMYNYLSSGVQTKAAVPALNIHGLAIFYFGVITLASYILYITKKDKG
jgi:hypothetical protein